MLLGKSDHCRVAFFSLFNKNYNAFYLTSHSLQRHLLAFIWGYLGHPNKKFPLPDLRNTQVGIREDFILISQAYFVDAIKLKITSHTVQKCSIFWTVFFFTKKKAIKKIAFWNILIFFVINWAQSIWMSLIYFAGTPATTALSGTFFVTTEPAPTIAWYPPQEITSSDIVITT